MGVCASRRSTEVLESPISQFKRSALAANPFLEDQILQSVFGYVGPGHWRFVAPVCSLWKGLYSQVAAQELTAHAVHSRKRSIICLPQHTLFSSAFASSSRLRLAHAAGVHHPSEAWQYAAGRFADIETLATARELGITFDTAAMKGAAAVGALAKVQWLHTQGNCQLGDYISAFAAQSGSVPLLDWLKQQGVAFTAQACYHAALNNQRAALQYLHAQGCPWNADVAIAAAGRGDAAMLRWLHTHGAPWNAHAVCCAAASSGCVKLVAWIMQQQQEQQEQQQQSGAAVVVVDVATMCTAAAHGHTDVCALLLQQRCPWDSCVAVAAARAGHASTLRWLCEHGCPCAGAELCEAAAKGGCVEVLEFLQQRGLLAETTDMSELLNIAGTTLITSSMTLFFCYYHSILSCGGAVQYVCSSA
jgi:hypothetical protein